MKISELFESLNDDDYYLVNTKSKTVLKRLGKQNVPFGMNATEVLKDYITDPTCQKIMTGMKVRSAKISESIKDFDEWKVAVLKKYPTKALKFKGRVESGKDTISAEVPGEDRSYGVWDQDKEEGEVLSESLQISESQASMMDQADRFKAALAARLKPLGFKRDRELFVSDDKVISVQIDVDENDAWVTWATGTMNGSRPKFSKTDSSPLEDSADLMKIFISFAKEK